MRFGNSQRPAPSPLIPPGSLHAAEQLPGAAEAAQGTGGSAVDASGLLLPEEQVIFDETGGHAHTGVDSHTVDHDNLANVTANQHHAQSHVLATTGDLGPDHTVSGLISGYVLRAYSNVAAAFAQLNHTDLAGVSANQHHNQAHALDGGDHTLSGSAAGRILVATSASAFAVEAPGTRVIQSGTLAGRPAANTVPSGTLYLATDDSGGTLYRSTGSAWVACGSGATPAGSSGVELIGIWFQYADQIGTSDTQMIAIGSLGYTDGIYVDAGTLKTIRVTAHPTHAAFPAGISYTFTVYKNGSATALTVTVADTSHTGLGTGSIAVADGDLIEVRAKYTTANPVNAGYEVVVRGVIN